jgi:cell division septation protein DedD
MLFLQGVSVKKYNFLDEPPDDDPFEVDEGPTGRLSPAAKRLVVIGFIGIVLAGGLYVYTTYFAGLPPPPAPAIAVRERQVQRPLAPPPPSKQPEAPQEPFRPSAVREEAVTSAQLRDEPATPPVPPTMATQQTQQPAAPPKAEAPQEAPPQAKVTTKESSPPAQPREKPTAETQVKGQRPTPQAGVKAEKPSPEGRMNVEKPAPQAVAKVPTPPETGETWYAIQIASLVRESNAVSLKKRLGDMGYTPDVRTVTARITHHRVYVGDWSSREEAERTARQLNVDGFPSNVVTLPGGKFTLEAGSFLRLNEAIDLAHKLQTKNHTAKIVSEPVPTPVHQVRVGKYASRAEAREALQSLKGKGFEPLVVQR